MGKPFEEALRITKRNLDRMNNEYQATLAAYTAGNIEKAYENAFSAH